MPCRYPTPDDQCCLAWTRERMGGERSDCVQFISLCDQRAYKYMLHNPDSIQHTLSIMQTGMKIRAALQNPDGSLPGFLRVCDGIISPRGNGKAIFAGMVLEKLNGE